MSYKFKLRFKDRMGIVADISTILAKSGFNIVSMEVDRTVDETYVYTEIEDIEHKIDHKNLFHIFDNIESFIEVQAIETLPQEEKANRFKVVLDNMSDGVISIDKNGNITTINRVAAQVFRCSADKVTGSSIKNLDLPHYEILKSLKGEKIENLKQNFINSEGRYQYISTCKPIRDSSGRIIGAVEIAKEMQEIKKLAQSISMEMESISFSDIIGANQTIKDAISIAQRIAPTDITVSLYGPSGTGKELFAKAIHTASGRKGDYVPVNCAALPEQLLESELFGYVGGSFTGGRKEGKQGLFEAAVDGTIFLDEIAEMPLGSQAKLLRLIQERAVRRVGSAKEITINTRIITATNRNLQELVKDNRFREDLYYRINVIPIHIPPLRERKDDIPILLEHFLFQLLIRLGKKISHITPAAMGKLIAYDWPGNVRELKNVIERAVFLSNSSSSNGDEGAKAVDVDSVLFNHELTPYQNQKGEMVVSLEASEINFSKNLSLKENVAKFEKSVIVDALNRKKTIRQAAKELQISHPALLKKMEKYCIKLNRAISVQE
ncbi:MAG: sigma 54-interacting transcriptional regulator [Desulfamplus sp.]|nr:sigma 54-interacting transcriptional regulator [Desulfamplus sp.]